MLDLHDVVGNHRASWRRVPGIGHGLHEECPLVRGAQFRPPAGQGVGIDDLDALVDWSPRAREQDLRGCAPRIALRVQRDELSRELR